MKLFTTILIVGCAATMLANPVEVDSTYFHPAASMYIHDDSTSASNLVVEGLSVFPENGKLLRLKELLDQQEEQEQNEDNQDQKQQDQNQDQQENDPNQDQDEPQEPQDPQQDDKNQEQDEQSPEPPKAEQMSQDEAERLLDAMKQEEENKRLQMHLIMGNPVEVEKDW
ncbi:MAG: hypothetical protein V3V05_00425 [Pontiella sp.]